MKKFKLSGFDLGIAIAAAVVTLLGAGAWYYFSGNLAQAQTDVTAAKADFDKYSSNPKYHVVVSPTNAKTLQDNIDLIKTQLMPVVQAEFRSKDNKLKAVEKEDPVAWKHDLDDEVHRLTQAAKNQRVTLPANFYFGFSRYLSQSPNDEQTAVLSKQLLGVEALSNILIGAGVKDITVMRRTYEEDPRPTGANASSSSETATGDHLPGYSTIGTGGNYTAYPFEIDFDTTAENLRTILNGLIQSPYVFVVRTIEVKNSAPNSPAPSELDKMAGTPPSSVVATSPGEVAATTSTVGPQFLFGHSTLGVKLRLDMIEWTGDLSALTVGAPAPATKTNKNSNGKGPQ